MCVQLARDGGGVRMAGRDLRPQGQIRGHAAAGRRKLDRHRQQRSLRGGQHRLRRTPSRSTRRLREGHAGPVRQDAGPGPAGGQQWRQPQQRWRRRLADDLQERAQRRARRNWPSTCSTRPSSPRSSVAGGLFMPAYKNLWTPELLAIDPNFKIIEQQISVAQPFLEWFLAGAAVGADRRHPSAGVLENAVGNAISGRMSAADAVRMPTRRSSRSSKRAGSCSPPDAACSRRGR